VKNLAASVRERLMQRARSKGQDFNWLLTRYGLERMLYRLSISPWHEHFLLKGALLFDLWFEQPQRPTTDIDLLGFGSAEMAHLQQVFRQIAAQDSADGMVFDPDSVRAAEIRKDAGYSGVRVSLHGHLERALCPVQIDIGFGDVVTPSAEPVQFPLLLPDLPQPVLRAYPVYTVIAEKYQAMVSLGMANTRMKDYFDLWILAQHAQLDQAMLRQAISATFARRATRLPEGVPLGLSDTFVTDAAKQQQWQAFLKKNRLVAAPLADVVGVLRGLLGL
jgi:predicted nucleotidyltransferase component of viral defense system